MAEHSPFAPSSAHRWLNCSGSVQMAKGAPDRRTLATATGTVAHTLAKEYLADGVPLGARRGEVHVADGYEVKVTLGMIKAVLQYVSAVDSILEKYPTAHLWAERRFSAPRVNPLLFGTPDLILLVPEIAKMWVWDYKHGKILVEAVRNPQLMAYAVLTLIELDLPVRTVQMCIAQPRVPHVDGPIRKHAAESLELLEFAGYVAERAKLAEAPDAPRSPGDWCFWCPGVETCPEVRDFVKETKKYKFVARRGGGTMLALATDSRREVADAASEFSDVT